jgi:hypothetical protein
MSEATTVEVAIWFGVVVGIVDLWELKTTIRMEFLIVQILMCTEHLQRAS